MAKKHTGLLVLILMVISIFPFVNVNAETSATVTNQQTLKEALANNDIDTITLSEDIETTEKINITRTVTIDGKGHTIKYVGTFGPSASNSNTVWGGIYVLQVYKVNATIKDIKLTGGNAGLLVNGGNVRLEGTIDVSGNGFGGIELGKGAGVTSAPELEMTSKTKLVNTTENEDKPTVWAPEDTDDAIIEVDGVEHELKPGEEISIAEYQEIFNLENNPETGDLLIWFAIIGLVGFITIGITLRNLTINKKRN